MTCVSPKTIRQGSYGDTITVPCGKCMSCRIQRTNEWTTRLENEMNYHKDSCFITLTYDDDHLPGGMPGTLEPKHAQDFIKRLRFYIKQKIKYYLVGEYGENTQRPHYHMIIFGWKPELNEGVFIGGQFSSNLVLKCWSYGFNSVGSATHDSIQYVVGYIRKKLNGEKAFQTYGFRNRPFMRCSQGLGLRYALDHRKEIKEELKVTVKGKNRGLPRYYVKKLFLDTPPKLKLRSAEFWADLMEETQEYTPERRKEVYLMNLKQGETNHAAILHLRQNSGRRGAGF